MSGVALDPATHPALARFLKALTARDASPHTRRSYASSIGAYLDWLEARGVDWRTPSRADLRAYLAELTTGRARSSVAQRLGAIRSFHRWAARDGLAPGDPWGSIATPRLPGRLPRVLEIDEVGAILAVVDEDLAHAHDAATPERVAALTALALRDRALVETAYAAGLRISELAGAELGDLDLRRGEVRVLGKGRKQRVGLLGRPARAALAAYLEDGRPILLAARSGESAPPTQVFLNHHGEPARGPGPALSARSPAAARRAAGWRLAAHASALLRDAPARRRGRPAGRPGAARPRKPRHHADLHARLADATADRVPGGAPPGATRPRSVTASGNIARAGLIVSGAFLASRILGWGRIFVITNVFQTSPELDAFFAAFRIPDLMFQLVAAGALSSALIPIVSGLFATDGHTRAWRVVSTVASLVLIGLLVLGIIVFVAAPVIVPVITPGFTPPQIDETVQLTRIMIAEPDLPRPGCGRDQCAQLGRPVRRRSGRTDRLQPRDHRGGAAPRTDDGRRPASRSASWPGPWAISSIQARPLSRLGFRYTPKIDLARPPGAQGARADGAAGHRSRGEPDHVHRDDGAGLEPGCRRHHEPHRRVHAPPDPDRRHRGAARGRRVPVALARGGHRPRHRSSSS